MLTTRRRVERLEQMRGGDEFHRWLKNATEEELDARILELDQSLRAALLAEGVDCTGLSSEEVCAIVGEFEANGGRCPARFENNQEISNGAVSTHAA